MRHLVPHPVLTCVVVAVATWLLAAAVPVLARVAAAPRIPTGVESVEVALGIVLLFGLVGNPLRRRGRR